MSFKSLDKGVLGRFLVVTVAGFVVDFSVAYVLIRAVHVSVPAAASTGFVSGFILNCILHDRFTYGSFADKVSLKRGAGILTGALAALGTRLLVIVSLEHLFRPSVDAAFALVLFAAGVSCVVNFVVTSIAVRPQGILMRLRDRKRIEA